MKLIIIIVLVLSTNIIRAQKFWDKIYYTNCSIVDTDTSITSDFHKIVIDLPRGWDGYLDKDDMPAIKITKATTEKSYSMSITSAYDASGIFTWATDNFNPDTYEIVEINNQKILIEKASQDNQYMLSIFKSSEEPWAWRILIRGAVGDEEKIRCDITFVLNQLMKKN